MVAHCAGACTAYQDPYIYLKQPQTKQQKQQLILTIPFFSPFVLEYVLLIRLTMYSSNCDGTQGLPFGDTRRPVHGREGVSLEELAKKESKLLGGRGERNLSA